MTNAEHYSNYQAVGVAQRHIDGKRILSYAEYCLCYPLPLTTFKRKKK